MRCILFVFLLGAFVAKSQYVIYPAHNYTSKDYGKYIEATIWCADQNKQGVMFFGTANFVLKFDGSTWEKIKIKDNTWITSIAIDEKGIPWIGGENEFGCLIPTSNGFFKYLSLSDKIDKKKTPVNVVWKIHIIDGTVYFQSESGVFVYKDSKLSTILPKKSFHLSFLVDKNLYVRERETGLLKINNGRTELVDRDSIFKDQGIFSMLRVNSKSVYIFTQFEGIWKMSLPDFKFEKIVSPNTEILNNYAISGARLLRDGNIAVFTLDKGVFIIDQNFNIIANSNNKNGLLVNGIKDVIQDSFDNLWLATDNGTCHLEYSSPFSDYNDAGITGNVNDIVNFKGRFFAATSDGVFIQNDIRDNDFFVRFSRIETIHKKANCFIPVGDELLIGSDEGLYSYDGNLKLVIERINCQSIAYSQKLNKLFVAGVHGIKAYVKNGTWVLSDNFLEVKDIITKIVVDESDEKVYVWAGTKNVNVYVLSFQNGSIERVAKYDNNFFLPEKGWAEPFISGDSVLVCTQFGLYASEFVDDPEFPDFYFNKVESISGKKINKRINKISDTKERLYIYMDGDLGFFDKRNNLKYVSKTFLNVDVGRVNAIYHENDSVSWIGGNDGIRIIRYNEKIVKKYNFKYPTLISRVVVKGDTDYTLFNGIFYTFEINGEDTVFSIVDAQPEIMKPVLSYNENSLTFYFSAPFYEGNGKMLYQYKLEGPTEDLSDWSYDRKAPFINLFEGDYTFTVKAKNVYGVESEICSYSFTILPPWYRTWWAYTIYVISLILLVIVVIRIYSYRLKQENIKLERIVKERTFEIEQQKEEITAQRDEIEDQHKILSVQKDELEEIHGELTDSINYAKRIQNAILPSEEILKTGFPDFFIVYKPRDVVSGDFYWAVQLGDKTIVVVADCTGHGVPGAFMSMLGTAFLNEIIANANITSPAEIMNRLRNEVIKALKQNNIDRTQMKDGMDMVMICFDRSTMTVEFAGANNPLYVFNAPGQESDEFGLMEIKGDKMPIAIYDKMDSFVNHSIKVQPGTCIYMQTDGYADQFGGEAGKKYKYKPLKQMLSQIHEKPMDEQKIIIENAYNEWVGLDGKSNRKYAQVDDITLVGIRI
ncbi:MAG: hypothetical protein A2W91_04185 [Bacteroidetes bacterium GWF2_38_335]|nr:MAG: hypothetical protein A2W91_04185 [Bacteroidetes bacterium GWF2_38_335]OFY79149.1 MAG: hypothetical protein A2281_03520 [Bacteroidetes bacterium RIFOXYA12_FULL_38_20]HBS88763.1 hypothetical protein [Bacteroidales bacterium]